MPGVQGRICSPKALQGGKASLARGTGTGCFPLCLVCILWAFLSAPPVPVGPEAPGWALSLQCLCSSGSLFACQVPMTSLYPSECLCLQETHVSIVPLKTSGPGYLSCRELQAPEPWSRAAVGPMEPLEQPCPHGCSPAPSLSLFLCFPQLLQGRSLISSLISTGERQRVNFRAQQELLEFTRIVFWFFSSLFLVFCVTVSGS